MADSPEMISMTLYRAWPTNRSPYVRTMITHEEGPYAALYDDDRKPVDSVHLHKDGKYRGTSVNISHIARPSHLLTLRKLSNHQNHSWDGAQMQNDQEDCPELDYGHNLAHGDRSFCHLRPLRDSQMQGLPAAVAYVIHQNIPLIQRQRIS